jgi:hypothetical protein
MVGHMRVAAAALALFAFTAASAPAGSGAHGEPRPIVVEVYTSQGCGSCVAANAMAAKVAQKPGVLLLSFPVTYWDVFGWKDTLANEDNTRRQKAYANALRRGGVYTPQMIVDGIKDVPAAREDAVSYALALASMTRDDGQTPDSSTPATARHDGPSSDMTFAAAVRIKTPVRAAWSVPVQVSKRPNDLRVVLDRAPEAARRGNIDATVWLFRIRSTAQVKIGSGENGGKTVSYRNVVTNIANVGRWRGEPLAVTVPKAGNKLPAHDAIAVVVQQSGYGRVVGAAMVNNATFYAPW